jgi:lysozyme family protein
MSAENFQPSLRRLLGHEGGYSNDPRDSGGATMWGITWRDYDAYRKLKGLPPQDVRLMTTAERDEIYKKKYWLGARCDDLPAGVDYVVFDGAVNSGVAQSTKWLQRAVGALDDGHIGDHSLLAAHDAKPAATIRSMCDQRRRFLKMLSNFDRFGDGWMQRVADVERRALAMVHQDGDQPHELPTNTGAKASAKDLGGPVVSQGTATATTAATATASATVQQIQEQLSPFSDTLSAIKYALLVCAVIGVGLTIYSIWKSNRLREVQ